MTVAPVVVSPENDSKMASKKVSPIESVIKNGTEPPILKTTQNRTTTINPSRILSSSLEFRFGAHSAKPIKRFMKAAMTNE